MTQSNIGIRYCRCLHSKSPSAICSDQSHIKNGGICSVSLSCNIDRVTRFNRRARIMFTCTRNPMPMKTSDATLYGKNSNSNSNNSYENLLDVWIKDSVGEIVKNLNQAPLLVQVYNDVTGTTSLKTEKAIEGLEWQMVIDRWNKREDPMPQGLIFVDKLEEEETKGLNQEESEREWGIVVQGNNCGPVCYLLKTSRVRPSSNVGLCCTHFCLVRVKSFRESARSQLTNCWLVQG